MADNLKYSVIVVEDEPIILNDTTKKIEEADSHYKVIGNAPDGKEALTLIRNLKPDLLVTDIRMPVMDGLKLISVVKDEFPDMQIIIISGYSEFEYARQAMKLGISNYLLKPLEKEPLCELLTSIRMNLESKSRSRERSIIFSNIQGQSSNIDLPYTIKNSQFIIFLISLGNLCSHPASPDYIYGLNSVWSKIRWDFLGEETGLDKWWIIDEQHPNQKFLISAINSGTAFDIMQTAGAIKDFVQVFSNSKTVNVAPCFHLLYCDEIWETAQNLRISVDNTLVMGESSIIGQIKNKPNDAISVINSVSISRLSTLISSKNSESLKNEFLNIFKKWNSCSIPQKIVEKLVVQLIKSLIKKEMDISDIDIVSFEYQFEEKLSYYFNLEDAFEEIWVLIKTVFQLDADDVSDLKEIADKIEIYIRENFSEQLSMEELADKFNFTQSNLTKIFKKYKNNTPVKFLTNLRLEEAKRLMETQPGLDLKNIGEIVGYSDQHYFSRVFKNVTGTNPSEYRDQKRLSS